MKNIKWELPNQDHQIDWLRDVLQNEFNGQSHFTINEILEVVRPVINFVAADTYIETMHPDLCAGNTVIDDNVVTYSHLKKW